MRNVIELRRPLGSIPIKEIKLNVKSRDDIPAPLVGLQTIYKEEATRAELFALLDEHILPDRRRDTGHSGMDLWAGPSDGRSKAGSPLRPRAAPESGGRACEDLADARPRQFRRERVRDSDHPQQRRADDAGAAA